MGVFANYHMWICFHSCTREWTEKRRLHKQQRSDFSRTHSRGSRSQIIYPPHLREQFPKFDQWLNIHVRMLKEEAFPVSRELQSLHCPPSHHAWTFTSMWAYGAHYTCSTEDTPTTVAYDCGIAAIPPTPTCTEIDVGILRRIILVTYMGLNCVVMEGSWIKTVDQGRRVVKKDPQGFWVVHFASREVREKDNPYVFPGTVSQVFFMDDSIDPAWKVVLRHDPRSKRIEGDRDVFIFGAAGSLRPTLSSRSAAVSSSAFGRGEAVDDVGEELIADQVNAILHGVEHADDERHYDDTQYEDEFEILYVE